MALTVAEQKAIQLKKLKKEYNEIKKTNENSGLFESRVKYLKKQIEKLGGTVSVPKEKNRKTVSQEEKERRANKQLLPGLGNKSKEKTKENAKKEKKAQKGRDFKDGNAGLKPLPEGKTVKERNPQPLKKKGKGGKATVSPNQKSRQLELPKDNNKNSVKKETSKKSSNSEKDSVGKEIAKALLGGPKKSKIGKLTADSTARGMSKFMGTDEEIAEQEMDEEMNFRKGGMPSKKTYGMRAGGFTKRGGMYKKGY